MLRDFFDVFFGPSVVRVEIYIKNVEIRRVLKKVENVEKA